MLHLLLALACTPDGADTGPVGPTYDYPLDDLLRLGHVQALGTHNSYHLQPDVPLDLSWEYSHAPLDVQLSEQGVRQFELDVRWSDDLDHFEVYHVPIVDAETTCLAFVDCLATMSDWSLDNPGHLPIAVLIEPKDEGQETLWQERIPEFEAELDSAWPAERLFTPDELQGDHATLREAVVKEGWPTLGELRGQAIFFLLDTEEARDDYLVDGDSLAGRRLFVDMDDLEHPLASWAKLDDPVADAVQINLAVSQGFMVRTRADSTDEPRAGDTSRLEAALASGAHWISTDYPAAVEGIDYVAAIPGGTPAGCNPVSAPAECTPEAVEDPAFVD